MMLVKIAWRNIWRNKVRSLVVIIALTLGLWAGIFASAFVSGMMKQKIDSVIDLEISHFQFHKKGFRDDFLVNRFIDNGYAIRNDLLREPLVKEVAARTVSIVMIGTANGTGGIKVTGISPDEERTVIRLNKKVSEGTYFEGAVRNPILISRETAKKYKVKLKSKVILTFQDIHGDIVSAAFRVCGIFETGNKMYDGMNAFVKREDMQKLSGIGQGVHELAVLLKEHPPAEGMANKYQQRHPDLEVLSWMDLATGMRYMVDVIQFYTVIIVGIILLALLFSIVNTMLMAVLERVRELGMLMAVGMNRRKVFTMIMLETIFLSLVGGPAGLLIASSSISYFGQAGINLGDAAYGDLGFSNLIFPTLEPVEYLKVAAMVLATSMLAAIYPALKALKLKPVEAIRKI